MTTALVPSPSPGMLPARLFAPTEKAVKREVEFFTAQINNDHTRKSYLNATRRFADWCDRNGIRELIDVEPFHVAATCVHQWAWAPPPWGKEVHAICLICCKPSRIFVFCSSVMSGCGGRW